MRPRAVSMLVLYCLAATALCATPARSATPTLGATPARSATPGELQVGDTLRDATLHGLNGAPRRLFEYRGKPLIINMWASWCGPCRAEMASLERLAWLDTAGSFAVIGISTDDFPEQAQSLLQKTNSTISQFIDNKLEMENMLGATHLPLTVLVGADGRVLDKVYGAREWDAPEALRLIRSRFGFPVGGAPPRAPRIVPSGSGVDTGTVRANRAAL